MDHLTLATQSTDATSKERNARKHDLGISYMHRTIWHYLKRKNLQIEAVTKDFFCCVEVVRVKTFKKETEKINTDRENRKKTNFKYLDKLKCYVFLTDT